MSRTDLAVLGVGYAGLRLATEATPTGLSVVGVGQGPAKVPCGSS